MAVMMQLSIWSIDLSTFDEIISLYDTYGNEKYMIDEDITQRSHALQAALIAFLAGAPDHVVLGLLVHDIGQLCYQTHLDHTQYLHAEHDELGEHWLKSKGFPAAICALVRFHTAVKILLCREHPDYFSHLSKASQESFLIQKEKYSQEPEQVTLHTLLQSPYLEDIKYARYCDDMAKIVDLKENSLPSFESYRPLFARVVKKEEKTFNPQWKETVQNFYQLMTTDRQEFEKILLLR
jgi:predicted HD phosphohydrolase